MGGLMDKNTLIANGCLGIWGVGLIGVFWKEVVELLRELASITSPASDFSKNRG